MVPPQSKPEILRELRALHERSSGKAFPPIPRRGAGESSESQTGGPNPPGREEIQPAEGEHLLQSALAGHGL